MEGVVVWLRHGGEMFRGDDGGVLDWVEFHRWRTGLMLVVTWMSSCCCQENLEGLHRLFCLLHTSVDQLLRCCLFG